MFKTESCILVFLPLEFLALLEPINMHVMSQYGLLPDRRLTTEIIMRAMSFNISTCVILLLIKIFQPPVDGKI